ncbi:VOC family protein [Myroides marinus]|uniref:VOC family protein n=1 Tax=Myroides marinus TaxID=703342 RepID=UPI0025764803|nr:VOC family protein [Myroides marinus]MDM1377561.1 VOC family protein [Myroides marinus]MDM1384759.1 VOC family protein [Myroides marinus]MDM1388849.1 VOC family protein [Myroides marinus]MDM1392045.1 VOC family protein [Myroides marinus]
MKLSDNIIGFHHYAIKAKDYINTIHFYKQLGFVQVHTWSLPDFNLKQATMLFHPKINIYLEIFDKDADIPTQGRKRLTDDEYIENALLHICFTVKDAQLARTEALRLGAIDLSKGTAEITLSSNHKDIAVRNSLVYSPNGEVIEFLEEVNFL